MQAKIRTGAILFSKGMVIGVANIIPGVSGGTLAVVLGIYDRLIEAISNFFSRSGKRKEYALFLATVFAGAGSAVVLLANLMTYLLEFHYQVTVFAFMGLIAGGIPAIWRAHSDMKINVPRLAAFLIGAALVILPTFLDVEARKTGMASNGGVAEFGLAVLMTLLFAGFMAGGGMIVPGISGSFILVLMGQYGVIMSAIKGMMVVPLMFVGAGAATGVLVFSKIIEGALKKMPSGTYYFILGLVMASLWVIFPGKPSNMQTALTSGVVFLAGAGLAYYMSKISA
jgi:putative membrane protein